jgi:hypothetical protein
MSRRNRYLVSRTLVGVGAVMLVPGFVFLLTSIGQRNNSGFTIPGVILLALAFVLMSIGKRIDPREPWEKTARQRVSAETKAETLSSSDVPALSQIESHLDLERERAARDRPPADW